MKLTSRRRNLACLLLAMAAAAAARATQTPQPVVPEKSPEVVMRGLRTKILASTPAILNLAPTKEFPRVYGVLMDWPVDTDTATVVAMSTGDASLYATSGGGILGGIEHERVRAAAVAFVKGAERHFDSSKPATSYPYPPSGRVFFYLLTFEGVRLIQADRASVEAGAGPMTEMFELGQTVLTELRAIVEKTP